MALYIGNYHGLNPSDPYEAWLNDAWVADANEALIPFAHPFVGLID